MLSNNGPSMEPYGTPKRISDHELYVQFNFNLCFRLVKYAIVLKKGYLPRKNEV